MASRVAFYCSLWFCALKLWFETWICNTFSLVTDVLCHSSSVVKAKNGSGLLWYAISFCLSPFLATALLKWWKEACHFQNLEHQVILLFGFQFLILWLWFNYFYSYICFYGPEKDHYTELCTHCREHVSTSRVCDCSLGCIVLKLRTRQPVRNLYHCTQESVWEFTVMPQRTCAFLDMWTLSYMLSSLWVI